MDSFDQVRASNGSPGWCLPHSNVPALAVLEVVLNTFGTTLGHRAHHSCDFTPRYLEHRPARQHNLTPSTSSIRRTAERPPGVFATLAAVRAALAISQYFAALLLGRALSAALFRRHLMVWKVFAPRCMLGAVELICVDVAVLVGLWLGVARIVSRITRVLTLPALGPKASSSSSSKSD